MRPTSKCNPGRRPGALAISLGFASAAPEHACRVRAAQIAAAMRLAPLALVASGLTIATLLIALYDAGRLTRPVIAWTCVVFLGLLSYGGAWLRAQLRGQIHRAASRKAIWRAMQHAGGFGALWGLVPVLAYPGSPAALQVLVGCATLAAMCLGGFMLSSIPLAGGLFVAAVLAGATRAIACQAGCADIGLLALLWTCGAAVMTCACCNGQRLVEHVLAEARLQTEIAAREQAREELAQSSRMSALGALASGVAHDFNNILQSVTGNATLLARQANDPRQARLLAGLILDAAERGGSISRRLLAFARQDALSADPVDVAEVLQSAAALLEHTLHRSICLAVSVAPDLPWVLADKAQLETVLVNLAANARDAMPRGGTLTFEAVAEEIAHARADPPLPAGAFVRITVADNGAGMDAQTLARAVEPFFTTKPKGKGTGLGLSMAKGFAEQSGGALSIASKPGIGTVVTLWLPQTSEPVPAPRLLQVPHVGSGPAPRLLVVDDDADVRDSLVRALEDAGFDAIGVANAMMARSLIDRGLHIDLLITDLSMPGLTGMDLLDEVQAMHPEMPAILLTGNVDDVSDAFGARFTLLRKPIQPAQLIHQVWQSLSPQMVT